MKKTTLLSVFFLAATLLLTTGAGCNEKNNTTTTLQTKNTNTQTEQNTEVSATKTTNTNQNQPQPEIEKETGLYTNPSGFFSVTLPQGYEITDEQVRTTYSDGSEWLWLDFEKTAEGITRTLHIDVNPDGYGPFFSTRIYTIGENAANKIEILDTEEIDPSEYEDVGLGDTTSYNAKTYETSNDNTYFIRFGYDSAQIDLSEEFEQILTSFTVLPTSNQISVRAQSPDEFGWDDIYIVYANGEEIGQIELDESSQILSEEDKDKNYYIRLTSVELGGYIPFPAYGDLWRINKATLEIEDVAFQTKVSDDESLAVGVNENEIRITDTNTLEETSYPLTLDFSEVGLRATDENDDHYVGGALLSPNNQFVAFTIIGTDWQSTEHQEESSIYMYDLNSGELIEMAKSTGVIIPKKWESDNTLTYGTSDTEANNQTTSRL